MGIIQYNPGNLIEMIHNGISLTMIIDGVSINGATPLLLDGVYFHGEIPSSKTGLRTGVVARFFIVNGTRRTLSSWPSIRYIHSLKKALSEVSTIFHRYVRSSPPGWWFGCHLDYFPINIGLHSSSLNWLIFFRGVAKNHQPESCHGLCKGIYRPERWVLCYSFSSFSVPDMANSTGTQRGF